jgi:CBS domain-containing protein
MDTMRDILELKGRTVHTTVLSATVDEAVIEMCRAKIGALLVFDGGGKAAGILSERDLLVRVLLGHRDPAETTVEDVMTRKVFCIDVDESVSEAMGAMTRGRYRHLPVTAEGKVVGMVSIGDLVRAVSGDQERELQALHEYVEGRYPR